MEDSPTKKLTFRQAIAGKWQIPLFALSVLAFCSVLFWLRPREEVESFDEQYEQLQRLAEENCYHDFYLSAETVRQAAGTQEQLGQVHGLVAQTRVRELAQCKEIGIDVAPPSDPTNLQWVVNDYREALKRNWVDPNSPEAAGVYADLSLVFWGLNETERAIAILNRSIELSEEYNCGLQRNLVRMYLLSRPKGYLDRCLELVEGMLDQEVCRGDDRAWAFVRKAQVLIEQGKEDESLVLLNAADAGILNSGYGDEVVFLRGRALHHAGELDQADVLLRDLIGSMSERGELYAQISLELGQINYEQYRDYESQKFYQMMVETQIGKDWYALGKLGLAECAALQQRYKEAASLYQDTIDLLAEKPNRYLDRERVQSSLILLTEELSFRKQYDTAMTFAELEQQISSEKDLWAADRFARTHYQLALQMLEQMEQTQKQSSGQEMSENEKVWLDQQQELMKHHFIQAARHFLRVADLAVGENEVYVDSLWYGAVCFDKAGETAEAIGTWNRYVEERQGGAMWPRALFYLAQAQQSTGQFQEAISNYELLRVRHPNSPAAFDSIIPLARCFLSLDTPEKDKAERLLISVLNDPAHDPPSVYFQQALFELGDLYYNDQKYDKAIHELTEGIDRYPNDPSLGKYMFLVGDSYRKSGLDLDLKLQQLKRDPAAAINSEKTLTLRKSYLNQAWEYFGRAIDVLEAIPESRRSVLEELYLQHCWMYQADCLFDLGLYEKALEAYEEVALRYQLTPTALTAFVQIVNCHTQLGNPQGASSANQRAIWQLRNISDAVLEKSSMPISRDQWRQWFQWVDQAGLW